MKFQIIETSKYINFSFNLKMIMASKKNYNLKLARIIVRFRFYFWKRLFFRWICAQTSESESESEDNNLSSMHEGHSNLDYQMFRLDQHVHDYPWLYFNVIDAGYKCKLCKMFPPISSAGGNARLRFVSEAVKSLTDHPQCFLDGHRNSFKHINATKQYEGIISFHSRSQFSTLEYCHLVIFFHNFKFSWQCIWCIKQLQWS